MAPRGRGSPCTPRPRAMAPRPGASLHPAPMPRSVRLTSRVGLSWPRSQHRAAWCGRVQPMAGLSPWTLRHLLHPGWDGSKPDPGGHTAGPERSHAGCSMTTCLRLALQPQPRTSGPAGDSWPETQGGWWGPGLGAGSPSQLVAEGGEGPQGPAGSREWLEPGEGPGPGQRRGPGDCVCHQRRQRALGLALQVGGDGLARRPGPVSLLAWRMGATAGPGTGHVAALGDSRPPGASPGTSGDRVAVSSRRGSLARPVQHGSGPARSGSPSDPHRTPACAQTVRLHRPFWKRGGQAEDGVPGLDTARGDRAAARRPSEPTHVARAACDSVALWPQGPGPCARLLSRGRVTSLDAKREALGAAEALGPWVPTTWGLQVRGRDGRRWGLQGRHNWAPPPTPRGHSGPGAWGPLARAGGSICPGPGGGLCSPRRGAMRSSAEPRSAPRAIGPALEARLSTRGSLSFENSLPAVGVAG